jgi:hypothetical protein
MSRTYHHGKRNRDRIKVRVHAIRRKQPDFKRLSRALIELAEAELEKEAECEHRTQAKKNKNKSGSGGSS